MRFSKRILISTLFLGFLLVGFRDTVLACDSCVLGAYTQESISMTTLPATTLKKGRMSAGFIFEYRKWNELDHIEAHKLHESGRHIHNFSHDEFYSFFLGYGLRDDLELNIKLPVVKKSFLRVEDGVVGKGDSSSGLGDLTLLGKYRLYQGEIDLSSIGGIKFPTGDTSDRGFDGRKLEPEEQPGTGSFDYFFGLALAKQFGKLSAGGDFIYNLKTEGAQERKFGDVIRVDIAFSYPLREPGIFPNVRFTGEINNVSVPIPAIQNRGGQHPEVDFEVISGIVFHW
jgi:hypothetical protein